MKKKKLLVCFPLMNIKKKEKKKRKKASRKNLFKKKMLNVFKHPRIHTL